MSHQQQVMTTRNQEAEEGELNSCRLPAHKRVGFHVVHGHVLQAVLVSKPNCLDYSNLSIPNHYHNCSAGLLQDKGLAEG